MRVLWRVIVKEFLQLRRDRKMIPAMVVGPLVQLLALGFAANTDVRDIPLLVADRDRSAASRELVADFVRSGYFVPVGAVDDFEEIDRALVEGRAQVALVLGAGYGEDLAAGRRPTVQVIADGTDSTSAVVGLGYASRIVSSAGAEIARRRLDRLPPAVRPGRIVLQPRVWYNPDLKSRWFYVPAITALTLMLLTMVLPSMAVVREKEIGTLEQISVTPLRPWQLIVGKLFPFFLVGILDLLLVVGAAVVVFRVPFRGSILDLVVLTVPFLGTMLGLGLLASTLVRTQQQAMMTAVFLMMVPMIYLSGMIFPIENMPASIQAVTWAIPLRYYSIIIRGVFLKGLGVPALATEGMVLVAFAAAAIALASLRFRKSLD